MGQGHILPGVARQVRCRRARGERVLAVPLGYLRRQFNFSRDIRLFLLYNLLANVGWGVFALIFNLYLRRARPFHWAS